MPTTRSRARDSTTRHRARDSSLKVNKRVRQAGSPTSVKTRKRRSQTVSSSSDSSNTKSKTTLSKSILKSATYQKPSSSSSNPDKHTRSSLASKPSLRDKQPATNRKTISETRSSKKDKSLKNRQAKKENSLNNKKTLKEGKTLSMKLSSRSKNGCFEIKESNFHGSKFQFKDVDTTANPSSSNSFRRKQILGLTKEDKYTIENDRKQGNSSTFKSSSTKEDPKWRSGDSQPFFGKIPQNISDLVAKQTFLSPERNVHIQIEKENVDSKVSLKSL